MKKESYISLCTYIYHTIYLQNTRN